MSLWAVTDFLETASNNKQQTAKKKTKIATNNNKQQTKTTKTKQQHTTNNKAVLTKNITQSSEVNFGLRATLRRMEARKYNFRIFNLNTT
jgi:hypothetical protein